MDEYKKSLKVMEELFAKDCIFAFATSKDNIPSARYLDTYYENEAFYIVTYTTLEKVKEIELNPHVALCHMGYRFTGIAKNIGHPLAPENQAIREKLIKEFEPWYFAHNDEDHKEMCYIKVDLINGSLMFDTDPTVYKIDFKNKKAEILKQQA